MQKPLQEKYWPMYMRIAYDLANESKAEKRKVGALFVLPTGVMVPGWNGTPAGVNNVCEHEGKTLPNVIHAEHNALKKFLNQGLSVQGSYLFVTYRPCFDCCLLMADLAVSKIIYAEDAQDMSGIEFIKTKNIECIHFTGE